MQGCRLFGKIYPISKKWILMNDQETYSQSKKHPNEIRNCEGRGTLQPRT